MILFENFQIKYNNCWGFCYWNDCGDLLEFAA